MPYLMSRLPMYAALVLSLSSGASFANESVRIQLGTKASEVMETKITVSNLRRSLDFYTKIVGLKEFQLPGIPRAAVEDPQAVGGLYLNFSGSPAEAFICLIKAKGAAPTPESAKLTWLSFKVPDARAAFERAKAANASVVYEILEFMGIISAAVSDPDGYTVELGEAQSVGTADQK